MNVLMTVAYDGSGFYGWQRQRSLRTVQGEIEKALSRTFGRSISVAGTSRTDAGVHALGQRVGFESEFDIPIDKFPLILNNALSKGKIFNERIPGEIEVVAAREVPPGFHPRFSAVGKKYIYKINIAREKDIFKRNYFYQLTKHPDINEMRTGAAFLTGTHDFKSFESSGGTERATTVRTIKSIVIQEKVNKSESEINLEITGDGFLYNMVRIIVGTLVEVGTGKMRANEIEDIVKACDRSSAGHTAPPSGLYLSEVYYNRADLII